MASDKVTNYCDNFNNGDPAEGIVTRAPSGPDDFVFSAAAMGGIIFFTQLLRQMQSLIIIVAKTKQCISTCATDIVPLPFITRLSVLLAYMSPYSDVWIPDCHWNQRRLLLRRAAKAASLHWQSAILVSDKKNEMSTAIRVPYDAILAQRQREMSSSIGYHIVIPRTDLATVAAVSASNSSALLT